MANMSFEGFMSRMLRPTYVWRMASAKDKGRNTGYERGARTSAAKARRQIDDLVLERALVIADERRCAAVQEIDNPQGPLVLARCEYPRDHGPVQGRRQTAGGLALHDKLFDHAAPSRGVWWMETKPEEAHA